MTVDAVPRTARMIITRISQEGMEPNRLRTRTVASSRLGAAKAGNACVAIRWVTCWSESQYLVSIVFKIHLHCHALFLALAITGDGSERPSRTRGRRSSMAILWYLLRCVPTRMDANLLRMVTRDSGVRKLLGAKSQPLFEAGGVCKTRLD